jgi:adenine-specific DNA-methyltransferase
MAKKAKTPLSVEALKHPEATRKNIPTAEYQSVMAKNDQSPVRVAYDRRNHDLDPQLVWRGKDEQDWSDLVVNAPPLYIQEKVQPKALIDDLRRRSEQSAREQSGGIADMFSDFNGLPEGADKTDFYQHEGHWQNRMILGDSLQVMASLAEREGLRGKVQCIYFDPPYGIKFNSNFQWSTTSRDVKDGNANHITREPEQVKAFRDTWRDGIHSYLTYLRDRLTVARDLLTDSGSIFVQIGDENVHRVRAVMDEVFGDENFLSEIAFLKTSGQSSPTAKVDVIAGVYDVIVWYSKSKAHAKYRQLYFEKRDENVEQQYSFIETQAGIVRIGTLDSPPEDLAERRFKGADATSATGAASIRYTVNFQGKSFFPPGNRGWSSHELGFTRLAWADRLLAIGNTLAFKRYLKDYPVSPLQNMWFDTVQSGFSAPRVYVVQTSQKVVERCLIMASDPGDLVLDPTCGSGTTATVAEQWGRRWITIDTSRVALALARARIMGARYPFYFLADSSEGQYKEAEVSRVAPASKIVHGNIKQGFVYERVPHITLKSIANNAEIDVIWDQWQVTLEMIRDKLNATLKKSWQEWQVPRVVDSKWTAEGQELHAEWWNARASRQQEVDASIVSKAEFEYLYDKPYEDKKKVRVAGPFTVESLSPHRVLGVDENDELIDSVRDAADARDFVEIILDTLRVAGVQQAHKDNKIDFTALHPWPGELVCAEGKYMEGGTEKRAAVFIGPEFGTVSRPDLVAAAREAGDADFDVLIACAFNFDAHSADFAKLGRIPVLKARMNADLHMAEGLKNTGKGNLFVVFGEPDIEIYEGGSESLALIIKEKKKLADSNDKKAVAAGLKVETFKVELKEFYAKDKAGAEQIRAEIKATELDKKLLEESAEQAREIVTCLEGIPNGCLVVQVKGVDVFKPSTGEVESSSPDEIACWFIDTDYNEESFFVRHAYFLGANDPYKALKTTLKAEIDEEAWSTLNSDVSRPFDKPSSGRIAIKVINHLGDEVMKVFKVA